MKIEIGDIFFGPRNNDQGAICVSSKNIIEFYNIGHTYKASDFISRSNYIDPIIFEYESLLDYWVEQHGWRKI